MDRPKHPAARWWVDLNETRPVLRVPVKLLMFLVVVLLVLYPKPHLLMRVVHRLRHLHGLIEPNAPALAELDRRFRTDLPAGLSAREVQKRVEAFVHKTIPYDWDWNTWGVAVYIPTVAEVLDKGREDCDGRAVLAASLLRRLGQKASLVTDIRHMWVAVGKDELMRPGGPKSAVSTPTGTRVDWRTLRNVPRSLAFGAAVFPLVRELILIAAAVALLWHPRTGPRWLVAGAVLLLIGLAFLRLGVHVAPDLTGFTERPWASWLGLIHGLVGLGCLWWVARRARGNGSRPMPPASTG